MQLSHCCSHPYLHPLALDICRRLMAVSRGCLQQGKTGTKAPRLALITRLLVLPQEEMHLQDSQGRSHLEPSSRSLPTAMQQPGIPNLLSLGDIGREEAIIP